jgi:ADP-ribosylation factor protein 1
MGQLVTKVFELFSSFGKSNKEHKILMLGLDGAGKTTILYKLKLNEYMSTVPTIGFNVEKVSYKNIDMTVWDVGGQNTIRRLWHHYFDKTDALIFIVDSADTERMKEAKAEIDALLAEPDLQDAHLLVYANKMDIARTNVAQIVEQLELHKSQRSWKVQGSSAVTGDGLYEGLEWLSKELRKKPKSSN